MQHLARLIRPWVTTDGPEALDSMVMDARDRTANLAFFGAAAVVWVLVGARRHDARSAWSTRAPGFVGACLIGLAVALTLDPAHLADGLRPPPPDRLPGRLAAGDPARRWVGIVVAVLIVLRLQGLLELPIALFMIALVVVAEATLSAER